MTSRRIAVLFAVVCTLLAVLWPAAVAGAHNSLAGSDPADGATPAVAPAQMVLVFAADVPLDTASAEVVDVTGARTQLEPLTHGPGGDAEIVAPLPALPVGTATVRWRLVGSDGHPVTGRVTFVVPDPSGATVTVPGGTEAAGVVPAGPAASDTSGIGGGSLRWALRMLSYVGLLVLIGVVTAAAWLLPSSWRDPRVRVAGLVAPGVVGGLAAVQLLVLAGDIGGRSPFGAWGDLPAAIGTTAGAALLLRLVVAGLVVGVLAGRLVRPEQVWRVAAALVVVLLATWSFAGHARSMRWPLLGVPVDVAHHGAAAVWLGGLVVVGRIGLSARSPEALVPPLQRFSRLARLAVGVLVVTGVVQAVRLTGLPDLSFGSAHTNLLLGKVVVLGAMLAVADVNRKRVARRFADPRRVNAGVTWALRRAMVVELCLGLAIVALTAALVVSTPPVGVVGA
jgi:copper transport protein